MKRKIKSVKGFTLAELLIVVAIIAVLVAIGIPIFTSQLEKSREAVDLSDVRSAYAEVMMAAITGDTTAYYTKDANQTIYKTSAETFNGYTGEAGAYSITVTPLKQKQPGWQTAEPITIGGVSSKAGVPYWNGQPGLDGYCIVTYHPPVGSNVEYVSFYWSGGNDSSNSTVTPTPENPWIPTMTPAPIATPTSVPLNSQKNYEDAKKSAETYPTSNQKYVRGNLYLYEGLVYVCKVSGSWGYDKQYNSKGNPKENYSAAFPKLTQEKLQNARTFADAKPKGDGTYNLDPVSFGDIYRDDENQYYIYVGSQNDTIMSIPSESAFKNEGDNWVPIKF